jgi:two-component system response regulator YesN
VYVYKLILVEDEIETLENIVRNIDWETCGFTLAGKALSGQEALSLADQVKPDLIITDIRMPYMDGFEMIRRMHEKDSSVCYLIISGHDEFDYAQTASAIWRAGLHYKARYQGDCRKIIE